MDDVHHSKLAAAGTTTVQPVQPSCHCAEARKKRTRAATQDVDGGYYTTSTPIKKPGLLAGLSAFESWFVCRGQPDSIGALAVPQAP